MTPAQLHLDGREQSARVCACGCGASLDGMRRDAIWVSRAHAVRWGRSNPGKSLKDAHSANKGRTQTRDRPSGLQVSFWKAQRALEEFLDLHDVRAARNLSVSILAEGLSDRQRTLLHERKRAKRAPTLTVAEQREAYQRLEEAA